MSQFSFSQINFGSVYVGGGAMGGTTAESGGQKKSEMSDFAPEGTLLEQFNGQKRKRVSSELEQAGEKERVRLDLQVQLAPSLQEHTKQVEK